MSCDGDQDCSVVLQLLKWNRLRFPIIPSEYLLASISPTRNILSLLSCQHESILYPLTYAKVENLSGADSPQLETVEVISDVKSLAWGHYGDAYNQVEDSCFRDILIVSSENKITLHAFRDPNRNKVLESVEDCKELHGKWVEWGPTRNETENYLDINTCEYVDMPRKWFRTFLVKLDSKFSNGRYVVKFPSKSFLPPHAEVASFEIYDNTLEFLCSTVFSGEQNSSDENEGIRYQCLKVFNNSSHSMIGMVLKFPSKVFIVVIMFNKWGLHWVCSIDLQAQLSSQVQSQEWEDFQFCSDFLVCLNTVGIICIFGGKSGKLVSCFDVNNYASCNQLKMPVNMDSSIQTKKCDEERVFGRKFVRLLMDSHSFLISVIDEHGVVYLILAAKYMLEKCAKFERYSHPYDYTDYCVLGGCDISIQKTFSNDSISHSKSHNHTSGFSTSSWNNIRRSPTPLRKVFLPLDKSQRYDCICLLPSGLIRVLSSGSRDQQNNYAIVHSSLHVLSPASDDKDLNKEEVTFSGDFIGCSFQGYLYLVTQDGLSVILPSVSIASSVYSTKFIRYWQPNTNEGSNASEIKDYLVHNEIKELAMPWQMEILDRSLLYEGHDEAEQVCLNNGWNLKIASVRRMQLALHYLKIEEIEKCLNMLAEVSLAEEGILQLVFTSVHLTLCKSTSDGKAALASRLLALAASFATKMIRRYGVTGQNKGKQINTLDDNTDLSYGQQLIKINDLYGSGIYKRQCEMAQLLEVIRIFQCRQSLKYRKQALAGGTDTTSMVDSSALQDDSLIPNAKIDSAQLEVQGIAPNLSIVQSNKFTSSLENPTNMIARWAIENMDLKAMVKDALNSGRLPLVVLQLHLMHKKELVSNKDSRDTFSEISDIGRAIAYDLLLKGESELAVETLLRLGEDVELLLKQLLFGTVRRSMRKLVLEEIKKFGSLRPHEWKILERIFLIEELYPCISFLTTFLQRKTGDTSSITLPDTNSLNLKLYVDDNFSIECGDIDGVVTGSWANVVNVSPEICEDNQHEAYWACAAIWSDAWDQRTVDRVMLDQPIHVEINTSWESQFEYHMSHNNWEEVHKLLEFVPTSLLSEGNLEINLNNSQDKTQTTFPNSIYICDSDEIEPMCMDIPDVMFLRSSALNKCSSLLKILVEQELAKNYIFIQKYWDSTAEIMPLLVRAGLVVDRLKVRTNDKSSIPSLDLAILDGGKLPHKDAEFAIPKLILHYSTQYNVPNLLDLYLDFCDWVLNIDSISPLLEAAEDCQWAKWLLLSRIKGHEYEASLSNARANSSHQMIHGSNRRVSESDDMVYMVDDIAEGGGEMAALATLMFSSKPMQKCVCAGSVNRNNGFSFQCTLENLRPSLQHFPTLWRSLVNACFGQDNSACSLNSNVTNVTGKSTLSDYLKWRDTIFSSTDGETTLIQMLPCWFPKSIRRMVTLFFQGPLGLQLNNGEFSLYRESSYIVNTTGNAGISPLSWEAAIQRSVEELYSPLEEKGLGVEHHLHRGRALAAFNHILDIRASKLKSMHVHKELTGQNLQSDMQAILAPLSQSEEPLLKSVIPFAIMHFEDSVLVASCSFLLELCGYSACMLHIDVAVLHRISSYYSSDIHDAHDGHDSPRGSTSHAVSKDGDIILSLMQALANNYIHHDHNSFGGSSEKQPLSSLMTVLHHLEKTSLPLIEDGKSSGCWLSSGRGDGYAFRSQQKDASMQWKLVTTFCQMHNLPLSKKYLALLANDNDWVGFLTEAQTGGYSSDAIIQVAAKEFKDARLKTHILTVLKSMQLNKKKTNSSSTTIETFQSPESNTMLPIELFGILAECERQKNPGEALLRKAKDLSWPLLAMTASCYSDVSPLTCLTVWLEITAARETSSIKVNDISSKIAKNVGAAVVATNNLPRGSKSLVYHYNRKNPKRRRITEPKHWNVDNFDNVRITPSSTVVSISQEINREDKYNFFTEMKKVSVDCDEELASLTSMIAVLCEQHLFLPLLRAFEMFLPSCSLLPFIRSLQAFSQMRLSEASAHLASFSIRIKEEPFHYHSNIVRDNLIKTSWITSTAVKAAEAILSTSPSAYERRCLLELLSAIDFGDGGSASAYFKRLYWKINLAEPSLRKNEDAYLGHETYDDASLLEALENNGRWEQARSWAKQMEASGTFGKDAVHHVTEAQAEAMVAEWKEYLWDVPEERAALWGHCQTLFVRHSFPPLQAGLFFLKHEEAVEKDIPATELHEMLLLSLQWLSGTITKSPPVYPLHLLREIETRVWLLAVESEAQFKTEGELMVPNSIQNLVTGNNTSIIEQTANIITKIDAHINSMRSRASDRNGTKENISLPHNFVAATNNPRVKRRSKNYMQTRRPTDVVDNDTDTDDTSNPPHMQLESSVSGWEEKVRPAEVERAVLSLLEFGQVSAAKQLQIKLSPSYIFPELVLVDAALKVAAFSSSNYNGEMHESELDADILSIIKSLPNVGNININLVQVLESLAAKCGHGCGHGFCWRIIAIVKAAKVLGLTFAEAFEKRPIELLQLLSLKAQDSLEQAKLLVQTHVISPSSIARVLAESFLKGLLAAHRGGYIDSQKEEGPTPLLWRFSDFLKWAELCPSEPEIGHALMRLVMTGQDVPHACEVELLILSHHFYKSSSCLDGVDVLVTLAANRVESYVSDGEFSCLARLITGVSNFHALNFILNILIENGQLELLLQKYSAVDPGTATSEAVRGFRLSVLTSLKLFNPHDLDAFAMVYQHFDMKHETATLLESRSTQHIHQWFSLRYREHQTEDLLEAMRYTIEASEVYSTIDAGHRTYRACARASLLSLQIRIPDLSWLELTETNARRALVEQSRFQEALIVAEAYDLNQPSEWAPVLWNLMLKPDLIEEFVAEFVNVLPLQSSMLLELARFYRAEVAARGDQSHFSVWLSPGGLPAEWVKHLGRSFRCLLKRTRDLRVRLQLASVATGFGDVVDACAKMLDKVPENAGPLILRRGHGGTYLPLM